MQNLLDLVNSLNPMQRSAVELPAEHALILAGAGSGKTRVLTTRIAWIIAKGMARPAQILAVTFTNKAAREMRDRLEGMVNADMRSMWVGTFHGIAHKLLRLHCEDAGLPSTFQIIDSSDQLSLVKRLMKEQGVDTETNDAKSWQARINRFKEAGLRAKDVAAEEEPLGGQGFYRLYENRCQKEGLVDFAELLLRSTELLERNAVLREHYADRFRFVLVDEFQDTNALQFRWIKAIVSPASTTNSLFCVGDDDQSIYAFRGARVGNMADFVNDYHVKHLVKLEQNYRSTQNILDAANAVIKNNTGRKGKTLWTDAGAGDRVLIKTVFNEQDEANFVVSSIMMDYNRGRNWKENAILYRMNAQSNALEYAFKRNGVPYQVVGGTKFFERAEVKDMLAYLAVINNPSDDLRLRRIINNPPRGIGNTTIERVQDLASEQGVPMMAVLQHAGEYAVLKSAAGKLERFAQLIAALREMADTMELAEFYDAVCEQTSYVRTLQEKGDMESRGRLENVQELKSNIVSFLENDPEDATLSGFLNEIALYTDLDSATSDNCVTMMTMHSAKGLEFPCVYVVGVEEGIFPGERVRYNDEEVEEERRLCYVAMTRAKERLTMTCTRQRMLFGRTSVSEPSRFLEEVPSENADWVGRQAQGTSGFGDTSFDEGSSYSTRGYGSYGQGAARYDSVMQRRPKSQASQKLAAQKPAASAPLLQLSSGDQIHHKTFGDGLVISVTPMGGDALLEVAFDTVGTKKLMLKTAGVHITKL